MNLDGVASEMPSAGWDGQDDDDAINRVPLVVKGGWHC
jgi:hypothetical protein